MTLIQKIRGTKPGAMDSSSKENNRKSLRPIRNRRYTRRSMLAGQRPQKRLFTPEIKRYLKDWLVRRRDNPYPNREEKKHLSRETGLTYIQICNWFANWRRKLKNVNADRNQQTWGHLIRSYNGSAQGNVEQFSICSDDSIWSETEPTNPDHETDNGAESSEQAPSYQGDSDASETSTTKDKLGNLYTEKPDMINQESKKTTSPLLLSKWLESAARFQPSETNYLWWVEERRRRPETKMQHLNVTSKHDRDEVEAAVALTALACATSRLTAP